jgi:hypothetical protein
MLELTNLNSNNVELSSEEQKNINGAAGFYLGSPSVGAKVGTLAGSVAGSYVGGKIARGQSSDPDAQRAGTTFWTGAGGLLGGAIGGASLSS